MFHGSVPADLRSLIHEQAAAWGRGADVYVGCSGNYTIERVLLAGDPDRFRVHSNDVQGYSSALGWFLVDGKVPFTLKEEHAETLDWLVPSLDGGIGTMATIMLGTRFLDVVGKKGRYYERMLQANRDQWPRLHAKTVQRLEALTVRLASYAAMDVREWLQDRVPSDAPVAMFPPFFAGDYEAQFASIDRFFDWPAPTYPELDEAGKDELVALVADRPSWVLGLHIERPELEGNLRGLVQTTNRGIPIYVYSKGTQTRIVRPEQKIEPIPMPKIGQTDDLGDGMSIHPLTEGQFSAIRSQFMAKSILPGAPLLACAVAVDGKVIGAFALSPPKYDPLCAYLLSDFPVSWSRYRRLAKLVVMAALSRETQLLLQRSLSRRILSIATTAFSDNPQSAKYGRGIPGMKLTKRADGTDGVHRHMLNYEAPMGQWTLDEALALWKQKHAGDVRETA